MAKDYIAPIRKNVANFCKSLTNPKRVNNTLFSQNVALDISKRKPYHISNSNTIVIGDKDKISDYIKSNIAQFNASRVIVDLSGDYFKTFAPMLIKQGKRVYSFNLKEPEYSDFYNPLKYVYDIKGDIDPQKVDVIVDTIMSFSRERDKTEIDLTKIDPFWEKTERAFLTGVIYYVLENDDIFAEDKCLYTVLDKIQRLAKPDSNDKKNKELMLTKEIKEFVKKMEMQGKDVKTFLYYNTFLIAPEKTRSTVINCTIVDLRDFNDKKISNILTTNCCCHDKNIDFEELAKTETYVFVKFSPSNICHKMLFQMFFSQLISTLYDYGEYIFGDKWCLYKDFGIPVINPFDSQEDAIACQNDLTTDNIITLPYNCSYPYDKNKKIYYLVWNNIILKKSFSKKYLEWIVKNIKKFPIKQINQFGYLALPMPVEIFLDDFGLYNFMYDLDIIEATATRYRIGITFFAPSIEIIKEMTANRVQTRYGHSEVFAGIIANNDNIIYLGSKIPFDIDFMQKWIGKNKKGLIMDEDDIRNLQYDEVIVSIRDIPTIVDKRLLFKQHPAYKRIEKIKDTKSIEGYFVNKRNFLI